MIFVFSPGQHNPQSHLKESAPRDAYLQGQARSEDERAYSFTERSVQTASHMTCMPNARTLVAARFSWGASRSNQVDLKLSARGQKGRGGGKERDQGRRKAAAAAGGGGHAFSATNPYGRKAPGDKRQFTH